MIIKISVFMLHVWFGGLIWMAVVNLTRGSDLVTYLSGINNTIINQISSSYSTKSQYTNLIQIESHQISQVESIE